MFSGSEIVSELLRLQVSHVVWVPDSVIGPWEATLESSTMHLVRVCREGEAWPLAAGLLLGGAQPLVMMQTTGLFESGDAMRNCLFDLKLPLWALIGARNWLVADSADSARRFARPILEAWGLPHVLIGQPSDRPRLVEHLAASRHRGEPGLVVLAEGSG